MLQQSMFWTRSMVWFQGLGEGEELSAAESKRSPLVTLEWQPRVGAPTKNSATQSAEIQIGVDVPEFEKAALFLDLYGQLRWKSPPQQYQHLRTSNVL